MGLGSKGEGFQVRDNLIGFHQSQYTIVFGEGDFADDDEPLLGFSDDDFRNHESIQRRRYNATGINLGTLRNSAVLCAKVC